MIEEHLQEPVPIALLVSSERISELDKFLKAFHKPSIAPIIIVLDGDSDSARDVFRCLNVEWQKPTEWLHAQRGLRTGGIYILDWDNEAKIDSTLHLQGESTAHALRSEGVKSCRCCRFFQTFTQKYGTKTVVLKLADQFLNCQSNTLSCCKWVLDGGGIVVDKPSNKMSAGCGKYEAVVLNLATGWLSDYDVERILERGANTVFDFQHWPTLSSNAGPQEYAPTAITALPYKVYQLSARSYLSQIQPDSMAAWLETSADAVMLWRMTDGGIVCWNRAFAELYGINERAPAAYHISNYAQSDCTTEWSAVLKRLASANAWSGEVFRTTLDARRLKVFCRMHPVQLQSGEWLVLTIDQDITAESQLVSQLQNSSEHAIQASDTKSDFLARMSHELRTPMTAVLGFAEILLQETSDISQRDKLNIIVRNGTHLLNLLNDILDLSRIEAGKLEIRSEVICIRTLLQEIQTSLNVRPAEGSVPLRLEVAVGVPEQIESDSTRIRQILVNLIVNALKFTHQGEVLVNVRCRSGQRSGEHWLEVEVRDTGIGMDEQQLEQLFVPFAQLHQANSNKHSGTGLGLNISKRLAEIMGGEIRVTSRPQQGSSFVLHLPVTIPHGKTELTPDDTRADLEALEVPVLPQIKANILLADDRRDVWKVAKYFLEKAGATVMIAEDGRLAIDAATSAKNAGHPFDLIIMDLQMPVMTGREAVIQLRRLGFTCPIIALTADAMEGERDACLSFGCDDYLTKPIQGLTMIETIAKHLQKSDD